MALLSVCFIYVFELYILLCQEYMCFVIEKNAVKHKNLMDITQTKSKNL